MKATPFIVLPRISELLQSCKVFFFFFNLGDLISVNHGRWLGPACSVFALVSGRKAYWPQSSLLETAVGVVCHAVCGSTQPALLRGLKLRLLRTPSWEARPERDVTSVFILLLPGGIASFAFLWDIQLSQWQAHSFNAIMVTIIIVAITLLNGGVTLLPKLALNSRLMWFSRLSFLSRWVLRYVPSIVAKWYYYYYYY